MVKSIEFVRQCIVQQLTFIKYVYIEYIAVQSIGVK